MSTSLRAAVHPTCQAVSAVLTDPVLTDPVLTDAGGSEVDLTAATPCAQLDLRALVEHVVGTTTALARLGLGEPLDAADPWGGGQGAADGDWPVRLQDNLDAIARGWSRPQAWEGEAEVGGTAMPRSTLGEMALVEVAMHGWDVARALGRTVELPPDVARAVDEAVASSADLGRRMGAYGPEVAVPDDAPSFDRALAKAGRDPGWSA